MALSVRTVIGFSTLVLLVQASVVGCDDDTTPATSGQGGTNANGGVGVAGSTAPAGTAVGGATIARTTQGGSVGSGGSSNPSNSSSGGTSTATGGASIAGTSAVTGGTSAIVGTAGTANNAGGAGAGGASTSVAGSTSTAECNTLDYSVVSPITATRVAQASPTPTGGTILDGVYHQIGDKTYTGSTGASGPTGAGFRSIAAISGNTINQAGSDGTRTARWTATFMATSPNVAVHHTCGRGAGENETLSYSVVGNQLLLYVQSEDGIEELTFARQ